MGSRCQYGWTRSSRMARKNGTGRTLLIFFVLFVGINENAKLSSGFLVSRFDSSARPVFVPFQQGSNPIAAPDSWLSDSCLRASTQSALEVGWFPFTIDENKENSSDDTCSIESQAVGCVARAIQNRLANPAPLTEHQQPISPLVKDRFMDLACTIEGENVLESLLNDPVFADQCDQVTRAAVMVLQSLCIMASQVGFKGSPDQLEKALSHLDPRNSLDIRRRDVYEWDRDSIRRLKFRLDNGPALELLAALAWKRTNQGAFDLLLALGAWGPHENLPLIRSGFPLRYTDAEMRAAKSVDSDSRDPDSLLGLRTDLRHLKVYTIDSATTSEIDDGLSMERIQLENGTEVERIWVHIADAERWASPGSELFEAARKRITSLYLPEGAYSMFPSCVSADLMSLKAGSDVHALSLGVVLNPDGSMDPSTLTLTPSLIHVTFRLTYEEVDEMLEEGSAYAEEWEIGALLNAAKKRRAYRIGNGSTEGLVPVQIPYASVSVYSDDSCPDGLGISVKVQVSHNAGRNQTTQALNGLRGMASKDVDIPVSASNLLVTEIMIVAGEAIGKWKETMETRTRSYPINIRLPFRTQSPPGKLCEFLRF
jgi:RNB domain